ncbi:1-(5-phosphoribosyl)-5-[(5-phosphoribosylamino)methylideneamino]imidazole-4-carboxamide isomerase [Oceanobacillus iheyensis]|uniref:1-(5-phosphoribosyl)-5-[(5-phosphoribosylamino)methylideneamino] imidazole-4-carboxamide isomerase n=1 Tax=Oceanobacillus jordanicus TaxID=2867266 RepID=A0AAW5B4I6_9BACI|nr:1-(5-phosphoribosyl)-5-[(5-phosphoribosylamino)methylideneamino]imidazole-4-carboxamide isomerase [Oceanobacillus jordanicus]AVQ97930.1 1-(5-phosphoribosyl)-5-[(5-phosphoribosylamino)methylideneamino]imidazole-4-carboxamide isomerase [Oceanobacillus iheyensis]MCG3419301.1 1-(5-phosphoribosyl)-5-[(5-phosphoribosylamino)methylideneamino]imidazole-4-carboxamide isomerase [Oceanobacillus jordanicus]
MILFPAIDIKDGKCVRLTQGDYNQQKIYSDSPLNVARQWEKQGADFIHIVDLDGAKSGISANQSLIEEIASISPIPVQVGGGIRSLETIKRYVEAGVERVIIGTAAIADRPFLKEAVKLYKDRIAVSLDARNGFVATNGWTETSTIRAIDLVKELEEIGVETIVYTDILKDGMLQGPNLEELEAMNQATNLNVIASGGVTTKEDIQQLRNLQLYGAIIGKALYDGTLSFEEIVKDESNAR